MTQPSLPPFSDSLAPVAGLITYRPPGRAEARLMVQCCLDLTSEIYTTYPACDYDAICGLVHIQMGISRTVAEIRSAFLPNEGSAVELPHIRQISDRCAAATQQDGTQWTTNDHVCLFCIRMYDVHPDELLYGPPPKADLSKLDFPRPKFETTRESVEQFLRLDPLQMKEVYRSLDHYQPLPHFEELARNLGVEFLDYYDFLLEKDLPEETLQQLLLECTRPGEVEQVVELSQPTACFPELVVDELVSVPCRDRFGQRQIDVLGFLVYDMLEPRDRDHLYHRWEGNYVHGANSFEFHFPRSTVEFIRQALRENLNSYEVTRQACPLPALPVEISRTFDPCHLMQFLEFDEKFRKRIAWLLHDCRFWSAWYGFLLDRSRPLNFKLNTREFHLTLSYFVMGPIRRQWFLWNFTTDDVMFTWARRLFRESFHSAARLTLSTVVRGLLGYRTYCKETGVILFDPFARSKTGNRIGNLSAAFRRFFEESEPPPVALQPPLLPGLGDEPIRAQLWQSETWDLDLERLAIPGTHELLR
jgi:hypothetical protein